MIKPYYFILFGALFTLACKQNVPLKNKVVPKKTLPVLHVSQSGKLASYYPSDSLKYPARVLSGYDSFHGGEVALDWGKYHWKGLFKSAAGYYIAGTKLLIKKAYDEMVDNEGQATGVEVNRSVKDSAILLFSGIENIADHQVKQIKIIKSELLPNERFFFTYNDIVYTLYATGERKYDLSAKDYVVTNYSLHIKAVIAGNSFDQMLVSTPSFEDALTQILFVGDIDGDNVPDLILDTTNNYNVEQPTLYLSRPATSGNLLKVMGLQVITGC